MVSPASPVHREIFERGLEAVRRQGFRVVVGERVFDRYGHLAGKDEARAADLHEMFVREEIDAVLCARGGSGSIRLLRHLNWDLLAAHPKPFLGYSDITSVELALLKMCRMPTFFAPMVSSDFAYDPWPSCLELLWKLVCEPAPAGELIDARVVDAISLVGGVAEGPCIGGTLSLVVATLGTPFEVETDGSIFFFEDVHESPARMERYLTQLLLAGKFDRVNGFLIGNAPYEATEAERARYLPLEQVYRDILEPLGKPMVYAWPHGHDPSPVPLPVGCRVRLDADRRSVTVLEPAVRPQ